VAKVGKLSLYIFILLFMVKAVSGSVLPLPNYDLQELAIEESTDNEESDDEFEFKFLADIIKLDAQSDCFCSFYNGLSLSNFKAYNADLFLGFINQSFRPPCDC
jgi:hypothetical protein